MFTAAQTIQCTNIQITDDTLIEEPVDETFNITLTQTLPTDPGVQLAPTTATVSIQDDDGKYCSKNRWVTAAWSFYHPFRFTYYN